MAGGATLSNVVFKDCEYGASGGIGTGCTELTGTPLPQGDNVTFDNVTFWARADISAGGFQLYTQHDNFTFNNVKLFCGVAVNNALPLFNGPGTSTYNYWRFVGCYFFLTATAAATKDFLTVGDTFASTSGAGNINVYLGGIAGLPSFSAAVNVW